MKDLKSRCACSAGGMGIFLCVIFMSLAIVGTTTVGVSKNTSTDDTDNNSMPSMSSMSKMNSPSTNNDNPSSADSSSQNIVVNFFSGVWGQMILLFSFGVMFAGIWFSNVRSNGRKLLLPVSIAGAVILYVSMYNYYSVALEAIGSVILTFVYVSAFSGRVAKAVKLM